jgi:oligoribonuclease NrnB/cAMP/cGMP phosphodiesterase (DHH superfamily)
MSHLCIYHKSCPDGFGAALAVNVFLQREHSEDEHEWLPARHDDDAPDVTGKHVYIVDFAYDRETLIKMHAQAASLIVIDHHKTAQAALEGLDFCQFDMSKSGAYLAWEHFNPELPVPKLIAYIQDRDIWQWKLPDSKEFSAGLQLMEMSFETWSELLTDEAVLPIIEQGRTILAYQQMEIKRAMKKTPEMITLCGYLVPCVNTTTLISDLGNELCQGHPFAAMYFETDTKRIYSLRSSEDGIDVSAIANKFGGGGHFNAAGFSVEKPAITFPKVD